MKKWYEEEYEFCIEVTGFLHGDKTERYCRNGEPNHWNKGIATEAVKAIIQFGFEVKRFHKINARFFTYNPASGRVMEKAGMEREGLQKKHVWKIDKFEDIIRVCEIFSVN